MPFYKVTLEYTAYAWGEDGDDAIDTVNADIMRGVQHHGYEYFADRMEADQVSQDEACSNDEYLCDDERKED